MNKKLIEQKIDHIRSFFDQLQNDQLMDLAHIGNTSEYYNWEPAWVVDVDLWLLIKKMNESIGKYLQTKIDELQNDFKESEVEFELGLVDGPYKPAQKTYKKPVIFLHLLVDTPSSYSQRSKLTRWCWRKYECDNYTKRLAEYSPDQPNMNDLLYCDFGINDCLQKIKQKYFSLTIKELPTFQKNTISFTGEDLLFLEFCFYACLTTARNHARILDYEAPDKLDNAQFFPWYRENIFDSNELSHVYNQKCHARKKGYAKVDQNIHQSALEYLTNLKEKIIETQINV